MRQMDHYRRTGCSPPAHKKALHAGGLKKAEFAGAYFLAGALRLNFVVNFSTRPAVSTRRFSPV